MTTVIGPGQPTIIRAETPTQKDVIELWEKFRRESTPRAQGTVVEGKFPVEGITTSEHEHISHDLRSGRRA